MAEELDLARQRLAALKSATFVPGSNPKRFVRDTSLEMVLSDRQIVYIAILAWTYRRQIPAPLVPHAKPPDLPPKERGAKKEARAQKSLPPRTKTDDETLNLFEG